MKTNQGQTESSPESTEAQPPKRQKPSEADLKTMAGFALTDEMKAELEREQQRGSSKRSRRSSRLTDAFGQSEARPSRVTVQPPRRAASEDSAKTTIGFAQAESLPQRELSVKPQPKPRAASPQSARPQAESRGGEAKRVETPKVEAPQVEAPRVEAPQVEAPRVEAPKVEVPPIEAQAQGEPSRSELEPIVEPAVQQSEQPKPQLEPSAPPHQVEAIPKSSILHELVTPMPHSETVLGDESAELKVDWFSSEVVFEDETRGSKITFGKIFIVLSLLCAGAVAYVSQQTPDEAITEKPTETTETTEKATTLEKTEKTEKPTETTETTGLRGLRGLRGLESQERAPRRRSPQRQRPPLP